MLRLCPLPRFIDPSSVKLSAWALVKEDTHAQRYVQFREVAKEPQFNKEGITFSMTMMVMLLE
jgi:hypothetical protein